MQKFPYLDSRKLFTDEDERLSSLLLPVNPKITDNYSQQTNHYNYISALCCTCAKLQKTMQYFKICPDQTFLVLVLSRSKV